MITPDRFRMVPSMAAGYSLSEIKDILSGNAEQRRNSLIRAGQAITFFLRVPSYSPDLMDLIRSRLNDFHFAGEEQYFMSTVPHLFMDEPGTAVIRVVVFERILPEGYID